MKHPLRVGDVMTRDVATVNWNDKLSVADDVMRLGRVRHMPVVNDDGDLVGLVTARDLFHNALMKALGYGTRAKQEAMELTSVKAAMTSDPTTIAPDALLSEAAKIMSERKFGCLPVMDDGRLVGILTEGDFVLLAAKSA